MPPTKKGKRKKRKSRKKQKGGTVKDEFTKDKLAIFLDAATDEIFLYYFYYSDKKYDELSDITDNGYAAFNGQPDSFKTERKEYIGKLITALQKYRVDFIANPDTSSPQKISQQQIENTIYILEMLNKRSFMDVFRSIFVPDNTASYSDPREYYKKETDITMRTLPNPLGFAKDLSFTNVLQDITLEITEKFPETSLDRLLHAVYNVENDFYLKLLLGQGNSKELTRILDENKKSQHQTTTYASSYPIIKSKG
uniref:Uncharacterized protein n=1 Tax=viral metagenome TaxID=1070528 RepID=A0A6C0HHX8_9ZZZZ